MRFPLLVTVLAISLVSPSLGEARQGGRKAAAKAFARAQRLFGQADFVGALEAFEQAYRLQPHYLVQCQIARCHERMSHMVEALEHYGRCLSEGGKRNRKLRAKVKASLKLVKARITYVMVNTRGKGGDVFVDGKRRGTAPVRVAINPGSRAIEVRRPGAHPASTTIITRGGEMRTVTLEPQDIVSPPATAPVDGGAGKGGRKAKSRGVHQAWFWTTVAVTAGLAAAGAVFGVNALKSKSEYEQTPTRELYNQARDRRLIANLFFLGATLAGAGGTVLFFFTDFGWKSGSKKKKDGGDDLEEELVFGFGARGTF